MFTGFWTQKAPVNCRSAVWRRPLLIFDIDGTLLEVRGVGRQALNSAFHDLFGLEGALDALDFAGATDYEHFAHLCELHPDVVSPADAPRFFFHYAKTLVVLLSSARLAPLPGVTALLARLSRSGWPVTLGTGNTQTGAYAKLGAAGLAGYFPHGGFSAPGRSRRDIIVAARCGFPPQYPAVVVGDTPRDIAAAHAEHLPVIGVATGRFSVPALVEAGADAVLADLTDAALFLEHAVAALL